MCLSICTTSGQLVGGRQSSLSWRSLLLFSVSLSQVSISIVVNQEWLRPWTCSTDSEISDIWVKWWASANAQDPNGRLGYWLGIYGAIGALALVCLIVSCW